MSHSRLTAEDIRAAAEVHGELGPDYHDAVIESFLAKIDEKIEARVDERLAAVAKRRPVNPARLSKYRTALAGAAAGSVVVGVPMTVIAAHAAVTGSSKPLVWLWVVVLAVYGLAAYRLRRR